ncbi:MAG TPA: glycosyltransferase family 4 protein [Puia sp.]|jgi:glycosyltransferase involved in cell wall biosynthesis|nr:glycosyltransferase family 4 protein [Puia sp.]
MAGKQSIAFVANTSWSIYRFRLYLIERLLQEGYTVFVLAPRDPYTAKFEHLPGLTYIQLFHLHAKNISPYRNLQLYRELLGHYRELRPGLIFHYTIKANLFGSLAARRARIPAVSVITGLGYTFSVTGWLRLAVKLLYRRLLRTNAEIWFLNEDDRQIFIREKLAPREKTFLLPGEGVDTDEFFPAPYEEGKKEITFLFLGRLIGHKGIFEFVRAAELLRQKGLAVRCLLLGFFDDNDPLAIPRQQIEEWTNKGLVTYLGHTDRVAPFIEQADCIVLPSYRGEGMPLSLLEGASMCKALIAADTAGCRAIIEHGVNGFLCREKDGNDLAEKMSIYYHLPAGAKKQMGTAGRNRVLKHFTRDIIAGIYIDKIGTLVPHEY